MLKVADAIHDSMPPRLPHGDQVNRYNHPRPIHFVLLLSPKIIISYSSAPIDLFVTERS